MNQEDVMSVADRASGPVIIAGAGPTGLTLATELRLGGAAVVLLDRRPHRGVDGSRAAGMQPRTIEMLDQRGVAERFLAAGPQNNLGDFAGILLDYSVLPSRFPHTFNILQAETEELLEKMSEELGGPDVEVKAVLAGLCTQVDAGVHRLDRGVPELRRIAHALPRGRWLRRGPPPFTDRRGREGDAPEPEHTIALVAL